MLRGTARVQCGYSWEESGYSRGTVGEEEEGGGGGGESMKGEEEEEGPCVVMLRRSARVQ